MDPKRVAIFGSTGQLGTDLVEVLGRTGRFEVIEFHHEDVDCADWASVRKALGSAKPRIAVNCAAFVRVDDCEDRPDEAFRVNAVGAFVIAKACAEVDATCVYISTDYVFDGVKGAPYVESDAPRPINAYGTSKLAGESLVQQAAPRWLIVRLASLFGKTGARGKGGNFVETVIRKAKAGEPLRVVSDVLMSPTYSRDAAVAIGRLLELDTAAVMHVTNAGCCSWHQFAEAILSLTCIEGRVDPVSARDYAMKAARPQNSCLESERLQALGIETPSWREGLAAYLREKGHLSRLSN